MYTYNVNDLYFYNRAMIMLDVLKPHNEDDDVDKRGVVHNLYSRGLINEEVNTIYRVILVDNNSFMADPNILIETSVGVV